MWDKTIEGIGLNMRRDSLDGIPCCELPERFGWRFYQPGDDREWARIWASAEGFPSEEAALKCFHGDFSNEELLFGRMIFLTDDDKPFATATAWFDGDAPDGRYGRLHWVGIDAEHQGLGLSGALVSLALNRLRALGHEAVLLGTKTNCWVAVGVYNRRFGFYPVAKSEREATGWKLVSERSGIDYVGMLGKEFADV